MRFPTSSEANAVVNNVGRMVQWMGDIGALLDTAAAALFGSLTIQNRTQGLSSFDVQSETGFGDGLRSRFRVENNAASELVDINLRGAAVNVGDPDPAASAQGTGLNLCGPLGDTSNPIRVFKPGDSPSGTNTFRVGRNGNVVVACGGLATNAFAIKTAADAQSKYNITETGVISWGPGGSTAPDTNLYRDAANVLKTDDRLSAVDGMTTKVKAGTPVDGDFASTPADGTIVIDTTASKLWARVGGTWKFATLT